MESWKVRSVRWQCLLSLIHHVNWSTWFVLKRPVSTLNTYTYYLIHNLLVKLRFLKRLFVKCVLYNENGNVVYHLRIIKRKKKQWFIIDYNQRIMHFLTLFFFSYCTIIILIVSCSFKESIHNFFPHELFKIDL